MKLFDLVLGSAVCLFGVFIGWIIFKQMNVDSIAFNRKTVIAVVVPLFIIGVGIKRIFKKRGAAPRS